MAVDNHYRKWTIFIRMLYQKYSGVLENLSVASKIQPYQFGIEHIGTAASSADKRVWTNWTMDEKSQ